MRRLLLIGALLLLIKGESVLASSSNSVSLNYDLDLFQRTSSYGPWHMVSLEYAHRFPFLTLVGRTNYARRNFGSGPNHGVQFEIDAWPKITKGLYGYLNLGYSPSTIFPRFRAGLEPYFGLPWSMETSVGIRYLRFVSSTDSISRVFIFTGHVGKYYKNYWFSLRPFLIFKPEGPSVSGILLARRYFKDATSYLTLMLGYGSTPEDLILTPEIDRVSVWKAGLDVQKSIIPILLVKGGFQYQREEYRPGQFGNRYTLSLGLKVSF